MSFRFRLGPLTFGKSGPRLSIWRRRGGFSAPLTSTYTTKSKKGRKVTKRNKGLGVFRLGPFRWHF